MSNLKVGPAGQLYDPVTGAYVGHLDADGTERAVVTAIPSGEGVKFSAGSEDVTDKIGGSGASAWEDAAQYVATMRDSGAGVLLAALGDSMLARPATYGPLASIYGYPSTDVPWIATAALDLASQSPGFVPASSAWSATYIQQPWTANNATFALGWFPVPVLMTKKSVNPTITLPDYRMPGIAECTTVTVYYMWRTNNNAPIFSVTVNGQVTDIDTYTPPISFGSVLVNQTVVGFVAAKKITLSTAARIVSITIDNMRLIDRGAGVGADGTAVVFGIDVGGGGFESRNLAIGSTTLSDASAANASRGITTAERVALAKSMGANAFILSWGTNDSKIGVSSPSAFYGQYNELLDDLDGYNEAAPKILVAPPRGAPGSLYENNPAYIDVIRSVAAERRKPLLDLDAMFASIGPSAYLDEVHPSNLGRTILSRELVRLLGGRVTQRVA